MNFMVSNKYSKFGYYAPALEVGFVQWKYLNTCYNNTFFFRCIQL